MRISTILGLGMGVSLFGFNAVLGQQTPAGVQVKQIVTPPGVVESAGDIPQAPAPPPGVRTPRPEEEKDERLEAIKRRGLPPGDVKARVLQAIIAPDGAAPLPMAPSLGTNFNGFNLAASGYVPPDPHMAAGPNHLILSVNLRFAIYSKTGSPGAVYTFQSWFSTVNTLNLGYSDPKVMYDQYAKRWIVMCIGFATTDNLRGGYFVSVSQDSNPTGTWYKWLVPVPNDSTFPDYPGVGYDSSDAVYFTANHFRNDSSNFKYAGIMILRKSELYANNPAVPPLTATQLSGMINPWDGERTHTIKPSVSFGTPISGAFFANTQGDSGTVVELWRLTDPVTLPTLTHRATVPVGLFTAPPDAKQPTIPTLINDNSSTIQGEVHYRAGKLYFAFPQAYTFGTDSDTESVIRYLELDTSGSINQNILYGADGEFFFFPAVIASNSGNVAMVFSHSSASSFCGARYVGNFPDDLTAGVLKAGEGTYSIVAGGRNRWGDYGGIAQDPNVPRRVWMYHEYAGPPPGSNWRTRAGAILLLNHPPQIVDPGPLSVNEEDTLTGTISVVEPDEEGISSFALLSPPAFASFTNLGGGQGELKLTPTCADEGNYTIQVVAADNATPALADTIDVAVTVLDHNCRPVAGLSGPDTIRVNQCQSVPAGITSVDPDASGSVSLSPGSLPSFATLIDSGNGNGRLEVTPTTADLGGYTAYVFASDGQDSSALAVPIQVFQKGDLNQDGALAPADVVLLLNCIFLSAPPPAGAGACDMDGGGPSPSDVVVLLNGVFLASPLPPC